MKLENNWRQKKIENLEKANWGEVPVNESSIVQRVMRLRKVPLDEFTIDDIRFMIRQQTGLPYLFELALEILEKNLFAEGSYYEGDLLAAILNTEPVKWLHNKKHWIKVDRLIKDRLEELREFRPKLEIDTFYSVRINDIH